MSSTNYRVLLSYDRDRNTFVARAPELGQCSAEGPTRGEAIAHLEEEISAQLKNMQGSGHKPPAPPLDEATLPGEVTIKLSQKLHRDLRWQAHLEGVDLEHLLVELLSGGVEQRRGGVKPRQAGQGRQAGEGDQLSGNTSGGAQGGGRRQGYGGNRYSTNLLDDRANFIEYVRNLEHNNSGSHPGGGNNAPGRRDRNRGRGRGRNQSSNTNGTK